MSLQDSRASSEQKSSAGLPAVLLDCYNDPDSAVADRGQPWKRHPLRLPKQRFSRGSTDKNSPFSAVVAVHQPAESGEAWLVFAEWISSISMRS